MHRCPLRHSSIPQEGEGSLVCFVLSFFSDSVLKAIAEFGHRGSFYLLFPTEKNPQVSA